MTKSVVVFGPEGCGKTRNARRIAKALGLHTIIDEWSFESGQTYQREGALLLTREKPPKCYRRPVMSYDAAMLEVLAKGAA